MFKADLFGVKMRISRGKVKKGVLYRIVMLLFDVVNKQGSFKADSRLVTRCYFPKIFENPHTWDLNETSFLEFPC